MADSEPPSTPTTGAAMPESIEVETQQLHEAVQEIHEERERQDKEETAAHWTRYISLTTAFLAVFAAIGSLQASTLVNEGMIKQLKASDLWSEYQASRLKDHIYTLEVNSMVDQPSTIPSPASSTAPKGKTATTSAGIDTPSAVPAAETSRERVKEYVDEISRESSKEDRLEHEAKQLEEESESDVQRHEHYAASVALIQVAIALSAIAALTKMKSVWYLSMVAGAVGIAFFFFGHLIK